MAETLLDIRGLKTWFSTDDGLVRAVDGVDLHIDRGETLGVVGESGCGKTVTARSVLKLIDMPPGRFEAGQILWQGRDLIPLDEAEMNKIRAREIDVAARLLARSDDLELLAAGVRKNLSLLEGWRYEQFGREAVEMVEGKLAFAVLGGKLKMTHIDAIHQQMGEQNAAAIADGAEDVEASEDGAE